MIDDKSVATKLFGHAPVAIAGQFILDVLDDGSQFGVCQLFGLLGRTIIVGAARQVHGFAPPPDGTGAGPLITKDFALLFAVGIRGVFLARSSSIVS